MDRKRHVKHRTGELAREEGGLEAERASRREDPARAARPHRLDRDERPARARPPDDPAVLGEQERAAERVARRGAAHDADPPEKPRR